MESRIMKGGGAAGVEVVLRAVADTQSALQPLVPYLGTPRALHCCGADWRQCHHLRSMGRLGQRAAVSSEAVVGICPPVVEYGLAEQAKAADEISTLPGGSVLIGWMAGYSVLREQVRSSLNYYRVRLGNRVAIFIDQPRIQFGRYAVSISIHLGPEALGVRIVQLDLPLANRPGDRLDVAEIAGHANTSRIG